MELTKTEICVMQHDKVIYGRQTKVRQAMLEADDPTIFVPKAFELLSAISSMILSGEK